MRIFYFVFILFCFTSTLKAQLTASFSVSNRAGCAFPVFNTTLTNTSTGTFDSVRWVVTRNNQLVTLITNQNSIQETYTTAGNYIVCLTVIQRSTNTQRTRCDTIKVFDSPTPTIVASTTVGCVPFASRFSATLATGQRGIASYSWSFPGSAPPGTSTSANPTVTYTSSVGSPHDVFLQVVDSNGCSGTTSRTRLITALVKPVARFTRSNNTSCTGSQTVSFNNTSTFSVLPTNPVVFTWDFGDGSALVTTSSTALQTHTYSQCGSYNVKLKAKYTTGVGCEDSTTVTGAVLIDRISIGSMTSSAQSSCQGSDVSLAATATSCLPGALQWAWNFGNGQTSQTASSVSHAYASSGCFTPTVVVTSAAGCTATTSLANCIQISTGVNASFTSTSAIGCSVPHAVTFTATNAATAGISFAWDFGDPASGLGNTSTLQSPVHTYRSCGQYPVRLIVRDANFPACPDTLLVANYIKVDTVSADFTVSSRQTCRNGTLSFTNTSRFCATGTGSYSWNFGGLGSSVVANPTFNFATAGCHIIRLTATSPNGCTATRSLNCITVTPDISVSFTVAPSVFCSTPGTITVTDVTPGAMNWRWNYDISGTATSTSTAATATHTYNSTGTFGIALTVTDVNGCSGTAQLANAVLIQAPVAQFIQANRSSCLGESVTFSSSSTSATGDPIVAYEWDFGAGAGFTAGVSTPSFVYPDTGCYTVRLRIRTQLGCSASFTLPRQVCVGRKPVASFIQTPDTICINGSVQFTNTSTGVVDSLIWHTMGEAVGGIYFNAQTLSHTYDDTLCFRTYLIAGHHGCFDTSEIKRVCVYPMKAGFVNNVDCATTDYRVRFTDRSGLATSWRWDFGVTNSTTDVSTLRNPVFTFPGPGSYNVKLVVFDSIRGCRDSITRTININNANALFSVANTSGCQVFTTSPTNVFPGMTTYTWSSQFATVAGQGSINPTFTYSNSGTFNDVIRLIAFESVSGCRDTLDVPVVITVRGVTPTFTNDIQICADYTGNFISTSTAVNATITDYSWSFSDNFTANTSTVAHTFTQTGLYTVSLTVRDATFGCSATAVQSVRISDPIASFTVPNTICKGVPTPMQNVSLNSTNYRWSSVVGALSSTTATIPNLTYPVSGVQNETITLIAFDNTTGCNTTFTVPAAISVSEAIASFATSSNNGCAPLVVNFTDNSSSVLGGLSTWSWNYSPQTNTDNVAINRTITYQTAGIYNVNLTVTNVNGCSATQTTRITTSTPSASFTLSDSIVCPKQLITITNTSNASQYVWSFGDGATTTSVGNANVTHAYALGGGVFRICVTATDGGGCTNQFCRNVTVSTIRAAFTATPRFATCPPLNSTFSDNSTGNLVSRFWNFGDGAVALQPNNQSFSHLYSVPGTYTVFLAVQDDLGCLDTLRQPDYIFVGGPIGSVTLAPSTGCIPHSTTFNITYRNTSNVVLATRNGNYNFNTTFSPNSASLTQSHSYTSAGIFVPVIVLRDNQGCTVPYVSTDTVFTSQVDEVHSQTAAFSCDSTVVRYTVILTTSEPVTPNWGANTGRLVRNYSSRTTLSTVPLVIRDTLIREYSYTTPGFYPFSFNTATQYCARNIRFDTVLIAGRPVVSSTPSFPDVCQSNRVQFTTSASTPVGRIASYNWNFGDGSTANLATVLHTYPTITAATTTYTANLVVTNQYGCATTVTRPVVIYPLVNPQLTSNQKICLGDSVRLTASGALNYTWSPAAGLSCTACADPMAKPTQTTTYNILFDNTIGCTTIRSVNVTVVDIVPVISPPKPAICYGDRLQLVASGGTIYQWAPNVAISSVNISTPVVNPTATQRYTLTVSDSNGCFDTTSVQITVNLLPILNVVTPDTFVCPSVPFQLRSVVNQAVVYQWTPANIFNSAVLPNPTAIMTQSGTIQLIVTNPLTQCTATDIVRINVYVNPTLRVFPADSILCPNTSIRLQPFPENVARTYAWSPSTGMSATNIERPLVNPTNLTTYNLTATFPTGCTATASTTIRPINFNDISLIPDNRICLGQTVDLTYTPNSSLVPASILWSPSTYLNNSTSFSVTATPTESITYVATITRASCTLQDTVKVAVLLRTPLEVVPPAPICPGQSIQLSASGADTYQWIPAQNLSSTTIRNPIASPTITTQYQVVGQTLPCSADTLKVNLVVRPKPQINAEASRTIFFPGESVNLRAVTDSTYYSVIWSPSRYLDCTNCYNPVSIPDTTITYYVQATNRFNCTSRDSLKLEPFNSCEQSFILVPNAFTPNGDGRNDVLYVRRIPEITLFSIYDRWGNLVFSSKSIQNGWDGRIQGKEAQTGVYVWMVEAKCPLNGTNIMRSGNVTLLR